ncbi:MAG TPA: hypothetical protein VGM24_08405 [Puia sp.]|jgi:hypothetical protein
MKLSCILIIVLPFLFFLACQPVSSPLAPAGPGMTDTVKKNYFPVQNFLQGEIAYVDSIPFKLMEYQTRNGKTDSGIITTQKFDGLARAFLPEGLDSSRFEKRFNESSFLDQTNNLLTFTYSTKDTSFGLRRVDVLATQDPGAADKVKSIYLEVSSGSRDSLVLRKMYWRSKKSFSILQIYQPAHGEAMTSQTTVVWDSSK